VQIKKVLEGNMCIGCGACAYVSNQKMVLNKYGEFVPESEKNKCEVAEKVCPSLNPELNEDTLAAELYKSNASFDSHIGFNIACYGAYVNSSKIRNNSTSGGFGTWIGLKLMEEGLIDGVVHAKEVSPKSNNGILFDYKISRTASEVIDGAKTRYHVLEMSKVLNEVKKTEGKFMFIGVPCFVKAIRRLQKFDPVIKAKIPFAVSLVCGHYKSVNWTKSLAWASGIEPQDLSKFQYRTKAPDIDPRAYVFRATSYDGKTVQMDSSKVTGGKFNAGAMMPNACNYCDDVVGETADISIGDAWLPKFDTNKSGTNLLIIRNKYVHEIILKASSKDEIYLDKISTEDAIRSQSGGFRQRREGLSYRLSLAKKNNIWVPKKRIYAQEFKLSLLRKAIYKQRIKCSSISRAAFCEALRLKDFSHYSKSLSFHFKWLRALEIVSSIRKILYTRMLRFYNKYFK
tara:strand:+ start:575 stop:1945 length:1371 start_codon:yes stop_codon:yes gene_type:complete